MRHGALTWRNAAAREGPIGALGVAPPELPAHDPSLTPRDEAIFLLHTAAEIEHSLLVQYLYSAYSLGAPPFDGPRPPANAEQLVNGWRSTLTAIAVQEMGHLMLVQNLLRFLGGPLNFEREDFPFRSEFYPFRFALEPLTKTSLAKYVVAEMPPLGSPDALMREIILRAQAGNAGPLNRVGALYWRIHDLFQPGAPGEEHLHLSDSDFRPDLVDYQASPDHWPAHVDDFLVRIVDSRAAALDAIQAVAEQGEGMLGGGDEVSSHFYRFRQIYENGDDSYPESDPVLGPVEWIPATAVPVNPTTIVGTAASITHEPAKLLAQLSNVRYRILLFSLVHYLHIPGDLREPEGAILPRGFLRNVCDEEMRSRMRPIARLLSTLPLQGQDAQGGATSLMAATPFELPYSLAMPDNRKDQWRLQRDLFHLSEALIDEILEVSNNSELDAMVEAIRQADAPRQPFIEQQISES
jgi:hypothetical protein